MLIVARGKHNFKKLKVIVRNLSEKQVRVIGRPVHAHELQVLISFHRFELFRLICPNRVKLCIVFLGAVVVGQDVLISLTFLDAPKAHDVPHIPWVIFMLFTFRSCESEGHPEFLRVQVEGIACVDGRRLGELRDC